MSDDKGRFALRYLEPGEYTLVVSCIGYVTGTRRMSVDDQGTRSLTVVLDPMAIPVDAIAVTPARTDEDAFSLPLSISITPRETFAERNFSTTAELLRGEPGILVQKTTHGHGSPILRGLLGKYVLLLYDGIRLNKPTFRFGANQYLNTVDLETLDRIEVVRGPSSVMYGSDAIGGLINLIPELPPVDTNRSAVLPSFVTRYSSADYGKSAHLRLTGNHGRLACSYGFGYKDIGDLRAGGNIGRQDPTGWSETSHCTRLVCRVGLNRAVRVDYIAVRQNEVPRFDKYASGDFERYIYDPQSRHLAALTFDNARPGPFFYALRFNLSFQREAEGRTLQRTGSSQITLSEDKITTWGGFVQFSSVVNSEHWLTYGMERYRHKVNSKSTHLRATVVESARPTFPDNSRYSSIGLFIQDEWSIRDDLRLTLGMRYSRIDVSSPLEEPFGEYDRDFWDLTGSLAVSYLVAPEVNLVGRWSRGFRAPNLNDAVVLKYSSSGVDAPSPSLNPESSNDFEIGVKVSAARVGGSVFLFYNQLDDLIERRRGEYNGLTFFDENGNGIQDSSEFDIFQKFNIGRACVYGFECESGISIGRSWEARANLSWTFGENQTDSEPLSRIPPLMGKLAARMRVTPRFSCETFVRFAGSQRRLSARDIDDSRIDPNGTPSWATLNFSSHLKLPRVSLIFVLDNLLDAKYKEHGSGIYSPGRGVVFSLRYGDL